MNPKKQKKRRRKRRQRRLILPVLFVLLCLLSAGALYLAYTLTLPHPLRSRQKTPRSCREKLRRQTGAPKYISQEMSTLFWTGRNSTLQKIFLKI